MRHPRASPADRRTRKCCVARCLLAGAVAPLGAAAEALVFSAARIDHLDTLIRPSLARGAWVICDRFIDSTRAYQGALGNLDRAPDGRGLEEASSSARRLAGPDR